MKPAFSAVAVASLCLLGPGILMTSAQDKAASKADQKVNLEVGDKAPQFKATSDEGKEWKSAEHVGKKIVVVYFYPADFTGGCTAQACGFRDDMAKLVEQDVEVVGISGDSAETHKLFKENHMLNFTLLADQKGQVAKKFGVPVNTGGSITKLINDKDVTLTRGVTISRWTFVIDLDGKIAYKDTTVMAAKDSQAVQKVVAELKEKKKG